MRRAAISSAWSFPATPFVIDSADFDGTNDSMTRGPMAGEADSKTAIFSGWLRIDGGDAATLIAFSNAGSLLSSSITVARNTDNKIYVVGKKFGTPFPDLVFNMNTLNTYVASSNWLHVLASWDMAAAAAHLYVNDVSDKNVSAISDFAIDYTTSGWNIGAYGGPSNLFNGPLAEIYFAPGQYLDLSVEANRRKFIRADRKPTYLGTDGSLATGTAPLIYQHLDNGESAANFALNRGTGEDYTITGTLDTGSTSPSD